MHADMPLQDSQSSLLLSETRNAATEAFTSAIGAQNIIKLTSVAPRLRSSKTNHPPDISTKVPCTYTYPGLLLTVYTFAHVVVPNHTD